jgi:hypothetical protein
MGHIATGDHLRRPRQPSSSLGWPTTAVRARGGKMTDSGRPSRDPLPKRPSILPSVLFLLRPLPGGAGRGPLVPLYAWEFPSRSVG